MGIFKGLLGLIISIGVSTSAWGADKFLGFNLNLAYSNLTTDDGTQSTDDTATHAYFQGGIYIFGGLIGGLAHFQQSGDYSVTTSNSTTVDTTVSTSAKLSGSGIYFGYHAENGFFVTAGYLLLEPKYKTSGLVLSGGGALMATLGYRFEFGDFGVGGGVDYYEFTFKDAEVSGVEVELTEDLKWTSITPTISTYLFF